MVEISLSGSGGGPGKVTTRGYPTTCVSDLRLGTQAFQSFHILFESGLHIDQFAQIEVIFGSFVVAQNIGTSLPRLDVPTSERAVYVQPSEPVPIGGWDYSDPDALQKSYDLGRRDGERFGSDYVGPTADSR
ncbi:MAG: hypothetical protein GY811_15530 [Myxococcales bacterium]|nr:hypothetical protein [Myxococcales bacterium]